MSSSFLLAVVILQGGQRYKVSATELLSGLRPRRIGQAYFSTGEVREKPRRGNDVDSERLRTFER
jgi:hypothetical protein